MTVLSNPATASFAAAPGVLVVDDDPVIRSLLETGLRQYGFRVWPAAGGADALRVYEQHAGDIRLALLDVQMPGQDGPETLRTLRARDPALPCFFMSGNTGRYTEEELLGLGAGAVLPKPFALGEVADTLRGALRVAERRHSARLADQPFKVTVREGAESWVKDRSRGGLCLWSDRPLTVHAVVGVRPADAPETAPWVAVEVKHCRPQDDGWAVGCRFVDPSVAEAHLPAG
jgi:DNA-binding response OmpR family regulator